jgi:hypothetical protein
MSHHQTIGKIHYTKAANKSFGNVAKFKHFGTTVTNRNSIHEKIKSRINSGNVCYCTLQDLLSFRLPPKNVKSKIYKTIILPVVSYGCETWPLTLQEEHRLKGCQEQDVSENIRS